METSGSGSRCSACVPGRTSVVSVAQGQIEAGARQFVETVIKAGAWEERPEEARQRWVFNAPTFLDEQCGPDAGQVDLQALSSFTAPTLLTAGEKSPAILRFRIEMLARVLPKAQAKIIAGAGHGPQVAQPAAYIDTIVSFVRECIEGRALSTAMHETAWGRGCVTSPSTPLQRQRYGTPPGV